MRGLFGPLLALCLVGGAADAGRIFKPDQTSLLHGPAPSVFAASGTVYLEDTFVDTANTALTAHTSDSGHSWAAHASTSSADFRINPSGSVYSSVVGTVVSSATPASANYTIEAIFNPLSSTSGSAFVLARGGVGTGGNTLNGYGCGFTSTTGLTGNWRVGNYANGTFTEGAAAAVVLIASDVYTWRCVVSGTTTPTVTFYVNGSQVATYTDSSGLYLTAGSIIMRITIAGTSTTKVHFTYIKAYS